MYFRNGMLHLTVYPTKLVVTQSISSGVAFRCTQTRVTLLLTFIAHHMSDFPSAQTKGEGVRQKRGIL